MSGTRSVTDVTELDGITSTRRLTIDVRSAEFTFRADADRVEPDASRGAWCSMEAPESKPVRAPKGVLIVRPNLRVLSNGALARTHERGATETDP